jgi:hypothetical protein
VAPVGVRTTVTVGAFGTYPRLVLYSETLSTGARSKLARIMDEKALVFISCGQCTDEETALGKAVVELVNSTPGLQAYFAENQASAAGVSDHILRALDRAAGFVAIMHHRGEVKTPSGTHTRASVWIEQEIGIVSFIQATRPGELLIAAYAQKGIYREGLRDKIMANPKEFETNAEVLADLKEKLAKWAAKPRRSSDPHVAIDLDYKDVEITQDEHKYRTNIVVTNDSDAVLDGYVVELRFPKLFISAFSKILGEDTSAATRTHRVFRRRGTERLYPGVAQESWKLQYHVRDDLYSKYGHSPEFNEAIIVRVYANDRLVGEVSKPFSAMQKF